MTETETTASVLDELSQFLVARISEDASRSRAQYELWRFREPAYYGAESLRSLRDSEGRLTIVRALRGHGLREPGDRADLYLMAVLAEVILRNLAWRYADHPDWREAWRPLT